LALFSVWAKRISAKPPPVYTAPNSKVWRDTYAALRDGAGEALIAVMQRGWQ
jgi:hypothetical protein